MLVLGINTATFKTSLTLVDDSKGETLYLREWDSQRDEAEKLLPQIKAAIRKGIPDRIFVVTGPGAFTALRIGVTTANTLAYAFKAPVVTCTTFEFLTASIPEKMIRKTATILRAGGEFIAVRLPASRKTERIGIRDLGAFLSAHKAIGYAVSDMSAEEKRKCTLPEGIKWVPQKNIRKFDETLFALIKNRKSSAKTAAPTYLLPPKITVSKKEVFV